VGSVGKGEKRHHPEEAAPPDRLGSVQPTRTEAGARHRLLMSPLMVARPTVPFITRGGINVLDEFVQARSLGDKQARQVDAASAPVCPFPFILMVRSALSPFAAQSSAPSGE
jgi:hypothetical protein